MCVYIRIRSVVVYTVSQIYVCTYIYIHIYLCYVYIKRQMVKEFFDLYAEQDTKTRIYDGMKHEIDDDQSPKWDSDLKALGIDASGMIEATD